MTARPQWALDLGAEPGAADYQVTSFGRYTEHWHLDGPHALTAALADAAALARMTSAAATVTGYAVRRDRDGRSTDLTLILAIFTVFPDGTTREHQPEVTV